MNRRHFIIKLPKKFVSVFDILLIIVSFYGLFNWPGGFVWFLLLCLSPLQYVRWIRYEYTDLQWSHEVIEKLFKENREPYKFNIINPDYNRVSEELIKKLNEFEECK